MLDVSSVFVEQIQMTEEAHRGLLLYGFSEKPKLSSEINWTVSNHLYVDSYSRKGFSLWLNKGSRIGMRWVVGNGGGGSFKNLLVVVIKGEQNFDSLQPESTNSNSLRLSDSRDGNGRTEYIVEEDDSYYIGSVNLNPYSIVMSMEVDLSSKMYDTTKATSMCSTTNGLCKIKLPFPSTHYAVLTTPGSGNGPINSWYVELSFVPRLIIYFVIVGFVLLVIYLMLKSLGACDPEATTEEETPENEAIPILPRKGMPCAYGTKQEDLESSLYSSSEDLYDGKICVICYDKRRNCFFVPCGHSITCHTCAQRIMEEENKVCPICRRLIHKVRKILSP